MTPKALFLEAMRRADAGDYDGFLAMQSADATWVVPGDELHGIDAIREWLTPFWNGFPGFDHAIDVVLEDGETVIAEGVWHGVHSQPLASPQVTVPPTGRAVSFRFAIVLKVDAAAGRARATRIYFDQLEFLAGLGLTPDAAAA